MKFLLIASFPDSLLRFRGPLIEALRRSGLEVHVAAPALPEGADVRTHLEAGGVQVHQIPLLRTSVNPLADLRVLVALWLLMRRLRPEFVLGYTVKPVIYGSIAARLAGVRHRFALITGLGYAFQDDRRQGPLGRVVRAMYRFALGMNHKVFFQNPDDEALFRALGILPAELPSVVVNGSGVDLDEFRPAALPSEASFLLIARLLAAKGVREYVDAARQLRGVRPGVKFMLAGWLDDNPDSIAPAELQAWIKEGVIEYLGRLADVRPALAAASVYVLPSYREGTPRTVLEAMAMGRAIITTDAPGCRETVAEGINGFLVPVRDVDSLAAAMRRFIDHPESAQAMGEQSHAMAARKFDVKSVNAMMLGEMGIGC